MTIQNAHTTMPAAIEIEGLSKTFAPQLARIRRFFRRPVKPPVQALRDVSLRVNKGEIFGLIGHNGAGKTTLIKVIATLVQPTTGRVVVNGFDSVNDERNVRTQVGMSTAEERSFYWRLTAEQNLMFFARLYGLTDRQARRRIIDLFRLLELPDIATRRFSELSTGNKQMMAIARSLLAAPPVLLLDEPTRSLDPVAAERMRSLIAGLARNESQTSILLTSHNLAEIEQLCDRIAIIAHGSIRAVGSPAELRANYRPTELIKIRIEGADLSAVWRNLASAGIDARRDGEGSIIQITRHTDDDQLDRALRVVHSSGARVVSINSQRPTLLEVLEGVDQHHSEGR